MRITFTSITIHIYEYVVTIDGRADCCHRVKPVAYVGEPVIFYPAMIIVNESQPVGYDIDTSNLELGKGSVFFIECGGNSIIADFNIFSANIGFQLIAFCLINGEFPSLQRGETPERPL